MSFKEQIANGGFESGVFTPWIASDAAITAQFHHTGFFAAQLTGGLSNAYISQLVPVEQGKRFELFVSLAKIGAEPSPPISISILYFDEAFNSLGPGLLTTIPADNLPNVEENTWLEVYQTTDQAPPGTTLALVSVNKPPQA